MNKKLGAIGIVVILLCIGLCGCDESEDKEESTNQPISIVIEAVAQVVNNTGEPVAAAFVTFDFYVNAKKQITLVRTTDSTGWTSFAVADLEIPFSGYVGCNMYLTNEYTQLYYHRVYHKDAQDKLVNGVYYWSISEIIVQG